MIQEFEIRKFFESKEFDLVFKKIKLQKKKFFIKNKKYI